ncbi:MAG: hypothetical protein WC054_01435 [Candidatus Nanopelagicales bacterium]
MTNTTNAPSATPVSYVHPRRYTVASLAAQQAALRMVPVPRSIPLVKGQTLWLTGPRTGQVA